MTRMQDGAAPHALPEPKPGRNEARSHGTTSPFVSINTITPSLPKESGFVHRISSGWHSLSQQVQMDSLIKMDHLAHSSDLDATTEQATPPWLGHEGR